MTRRASLSSTSAHPFIWNYSIPSRILAALPLFGRYGLWKRRKGHAERMLERAERIATENGHDAVYLEWLEKDTPREILQWYYRRGYQEQEFSGKGDYVLLKKSLTDKNQHP